MFLFSIQCLRILTRARRGRKVALFHTRRHFQRLEKEVQYAACATSRVNIHRHYGLVGTALNLASIPSVLSIDMDRN